MPKLSTALTSEHPLMRAVIRWREIAAALERRGFGVVAELARAEGHLTNVQALHISDAPADRVLVPVAIKAYTDFIETQVICDQRPGTTKLLQHPLFRERALLGGGIFWEKHLREITETTLAHTQQLGVALPAAG